ncbi:MAG: hypothetical protein AAF658_13265, partial [Myxococcota bacterium]
AVTLGAAEASDVFQRLDVVPELMSGGRQWAKASGLSPEMQGAIWAFMNSWGNAPGRAMATTFGPMVRTALSAAGSDPQVAELMASFAHLRLDPFMPAMTAQMAQTFPPPPWVKADGLDTNYAAGIAARVAGAFMTEFELKKVLERLPPEVREKTLVVLQAGSAAAQTAVDQKFAEAMPELQMKVVPSPRHDMYTFDPGIASSEALMALFPGESKEIATRYVSKLQNETQGFETAATALALAQQSTQHEFSDDFISSFVFFVGKQLAERQIAAELNLGLAEELEQKQTYVAASLYPMLGMLQKDDGSALFDESKAQTIALKAAHAQIK